MAIKILDRQYSEIYTDETCDWLLGNVGEWQKAKIKAEVAIEYLATSQTPVQIDLVNNAFILASGENWGDYGFDNGMVAVFRYKKSVDTDNDNEFDQVSNSEKAYFITNIYKSTMEVQEPITADGFETIPTNFGTKKISDVLFYVDDVPEGCRITYGHIPNTDFENNKLNSFIDGTEAEFAFPGLDSLALGNWGVMEPIGIQSGMSIRSAKVREVPNIQSGVLNEFSISESGLNNLRFHNVSGTVSDIYETIRSLKVTTTNPSSPFQNVVVDGLVPQTELVTIENGNVSQAFLYDSPGATSNKYYFNLGFRVTSMTESVSTISKIIFKVLRYTNGATMDFVDSTTLKTFNNVSSLLNKDLSVDGLFQIDVDATDSLVLVIQFTDLDSVGASEKKIEYIINGGSFIVSLDGQDLITNYKRTFEFEIQYMISSLFEELSDLQNFQLPSYLVDDGSLTDNFRIQFFPEWNNPNVKIQNDMSKTRRLGNTGWFNENFNELNNDFKIDSVEYFDINGNPVDSMDYSSQTKVKIVVSGVPNLGSETECGFGFAWIPTNETDYKNKLTPFYRNCFVQSGSLEDGFLLDQLYTDVYSGAGLDGASMDATKIKFTPLNGKIVFEANFVPNAKFFNTFDSKDETDRNYAIWISVADGTLVRNFSDRVALLADVNSLIKTIPPAGSYDQIENAFIEHPLNETVVGETSYQGVTQDDILCRMPLRIPTDGSKIFQRITFGVEAYNIGTNRSFELEKIEVDLSIFPITSDGVQQIEVDTTRGFKLEPGNNKNWLKIQREPGFDTNDFAGFICYFGTKIRWEDWIVNANSPSDFYDATKTNNGLNNDWFDYQETAGWSIKYFAEIISNESGDLYEYKNRWNVHINDYDQNENISVTHQYFRDSDDTLLNIGTDPETGRPLGVILENEPTRIEIEFEILDSGTWDLLTTYGVLTIEIDRGAGRFEMRQLSSVWGSETDSPLKPLDGETKLKIEVDGTNKFLKMSCLVDPDLLDDAVKYRITGRVGCFDDSGEIFDPGLYEFRYEQTYE